MTGEAAVEPAADCGCEAELATEMDSARSATSRWFESRLLAASAISEAVAAAPASGKIAMSDMPQGPTVD